MGEGTGHVWLASCVLGWRWPAGCEQAAPQGRIRQSGLSGRRFEAQTGRDAHGLGRAGREAAGVGEGPARPPGSCTWTFPSWAGGLREGVHRAMMSLVSREAQLEGVSWDPSALPETVGRLCGRKFPRSPRAGRPNAQQSAGRERVCTGSPPMLPNGGGGAAGLHTPCKVLRAREV